MRWIALQITMLGKRLQITLANLDANNKKAASAFRNRPRAVSVNRTLTIGKPADGIREPRLDV